MDELTLAAAVAEVPSADAGESKPLPMSNPKRNESNQGARPDGGNAVPHHADPGTNLSDLSPPVVVDDEIGGDRDRPKAERQQHSQHKQVSAVGE